MLLALRFSLVPLLRRECLIQIDFREFVNQIRQHECVGIIGIEKGTALLREIGLVRFFIDREKELLLKLEQFFFARVLEKGKLGFIDGAALVRIFHHAEKLFVARLTEFHLEHETTPRLDLSLGKFLNRFARYAVAKHILLPHQLLNERFPLVVLMRRNRRRPANDERRARFIDQDGIDFIHNGIVITDRKSTRLNSSHSQISYAVFCLKKKNKNLT